MSPPAAITLISATRGVAGDARKIRIGAAGTHTATFIAGVYNVNEGGTIKPLYINSNGQLGNGTMLNSSVPVPVAW